MVSWGRIHETRLMYEVEVKGSHLLNLNYDMVGIIKLGVTFFSNNCAKQSFISFKGMCKSPLPPALTLTHTHTHNSLSVVHLLQCKGQSLMCHLVLKMQLSLS